MIVNQLAQRLRRLVVGGVRFKHQRVVGFNHFAQGNGFLRLIVADVRVVELHARLDHQANNARPDVAQTFLFERVTMRFKRGAGRVRRGDGKFGERLVRATGNRHFRADNVDQIGFTKLLAAGRFGNLRQACGASGNDRVGQGNRVVLAGHAAVQVDLFESGRNIAFDQIVGICHRLFRREILPAVRAEMIAAEDQL